MAMIARRRSSPDMVSALLEEERAKERENSACAAVWLDYSSIPAAHARLIRRR
jgi:hypothetical protein